MRNMSFSLTTPQVRAGTKTVTRCIGWAFLKPGDRIMACVKCQGLGKGGKIEKIREIEVVSVRREPLISMCTLSTRKRMEETEAEGFPDLSCDEFVAMFCKNMGCTPDAIVTRIEFKYVPAEVVAGQMQNAEGA